MKGWKELRDDIRWALAAQDETRPDHTTLQIFPNSVRKDIVIPVQYLGFFPKTRTYTPTKDGHVMVYDTRTDVFETFEVKISFKKLVEMVESVKKEHIRTESET
jgi:hypothetical protein